MTQKTDRDQILDSAAYLFRVNGYHNTTVADIAASCGLLKGSLYHHFPSKEALAVAALDRSVAEFWDKVLWIAYQEDVPASKRLPDFADALGKYFLGKRGGSLFGNVGLEVGHNIAPIATVVQRYFSDIRSAIVALLTARFGEDRAGEMASAGVARIEGSLLLAQVDKDNSHFERALLELKGYLAEESFISP